MAALSSSSFLVSKTPSAGSPLKAAEQRIGSLAPNNISLGLKHSGKSSISKKELTVNASYGDGGKSGGGSFFIGGFILGGIIMGTLGCIYAPQISKAIAVANTDKKDLMRKLPKFIYDEDKALEKQRKKLEAKIEQLNDAIDNVSSQLRAEHSPNGEDVKSDGYEALA
ncbi:OLC1v1016035C1 [Oldenlandia corymbosa var. corymbosa]|uniref:OLC1v1016035C1 n=1 Tax=Oldenlandia corymbosa var. corymbosa TaxID=529605 RepID=A0AAV1E4W0_OLDCO|nr:OLC1v1016035C1 [Oldenlandia corymbosa var. corymbosa]